MEQGDEEALVQEQNPPGSIRREVGHDVIMAPGVGRSLAFPWIGGTTGLLKWKYSSQNTDEFYFFEQTKVKTLKTVDSILTKKSMLLFRSNILSLEYELRVGLQPTKAKALPDATDVWLNERETSVRRQIAWRK